MADDTTAQGGSSYGDYFSQLEQKYDLPSGYLAKTADIESGITVDPPHNSNARGMFQFMPDTAAHMGVDPMNWQSSADGAARLAVQNRDYLEERLGRKVTGGELYLAHQQGSKGAYNLLSNPDGMAAMTNGADVITKNGGNVNMTNAQFASLWTNKFGGASTVTPEATNPFNGQMGMDLPSAMSPVDVPPPIQTSSWADVGAAIARDSSTYAAYSMFSNAAMPDEEWSKNTTMDTFNNAVGFKNLSEDSQSWVLENSVSQQSMENHIALAQQRENDAQTMANGPTGSGLAGFAAGFIDPLTLALTIPTGGMSELGAAFKGGKALMGAVEGGVIAGAAGLPKHEVDPDYTYGQIAQDAAFGMALGAVAGSVVKGHPQLDPTLENDTIKAFVDHSNEVNNAANAPALPSPSGAAPAVHNVGADSSAGAARAAPLPASETAEGIARAAAQIDNRSTFDTIVDATRFDAHKDIINSGNEDVIATGNSLMPDPVGDGGVVDRGKEDAWNFKKRKQEALEIGLDRQVNDAFDEYVKEQNGGNKLAWINLNKKAALRDQFEHEITQAVLAEDRSQFSPALQKAAKAMEEHNTRALQEVGAAGNKAAQGIEARPNYMSLVPNRENMRAAIDQHGEAGVADVVAQAMEKNSPDSARIFASKFAHREARREAGWAVKDARPDIEFEHRQAKWEAVQANDDDKAAKLIDNTQQANRKMQDVDDYHAEVLQNAKDYANSIDEQIKALKATRPKKSALQQQLIDEEIAGLKEHKAATKRGAKAAADKARAAVRKVKAEEEAKIRERAALEEKGIKRSSEMDKEADLDKVWMDAWNTEADRAFKEASQLWFKRFGKNYVQTLQRVTEKDEGSFIRGMSGQNAEDLQKFLVDNGMNPAEAEVAVMMMKGVNQDGGRVGALRRRAPLDAETKFVPRGGKQGVMAQPLAVRDLFEGNGMEIARKYRDSMMTQAALAHAGFQTEAELRTHIMDITSARKLREAGKPVTGNEEARLEKARNTLNYYADRLMGYPVTGSDPHSTGALIGKVLRDWNFVTFMQQNGISQLGDLPKILIRSGLSAMMQHFNFTGILKALHSGDKGVRDDVQRGLEYFTGIGTTAARTKIVRRFKNMDQYYPRSDFNSKMQWLAHYTSAASKLTSLTSGASPANDWMLQMAARSTLQAFVDHAQGVRKLSAKLMHDMGFTEDHAESIRKMVQGGGLKLAKNGVVDNLDIAKLNKTWASEIDDVMGLVNREARTQIMETTPSSLPKFASTELGQLALQFRTYALASHASNTLRNVKLGPGMLAQSLVITSLWGGLVWAMQSGMKSVGMDQDSRDEYLHRQFDLKGWLNGTIGRSADAALIPIIADTLLEPISKVTGHDVRLFDQNRTSGLGSGALGGNPALTQMQNISDAIFGSLADTFRDDQNWTQRSAQSRLGTVLPWTKAYGVLNATQGLLSSLPKTEPKDTTFNPDKE